MKVRENVDRQENEMLGEEKEGKRRAKIMPKIKKW